MFFGVSVPLRLFLDLKHETMGSAPRARPQTMNVRKAVITAAGAHQRSLPLQVLIDRDGVEKPILRVLLEEVFAAPIEEVVPDRRPWRPGFPFAEAAGDLAQRVHFIEQSTPRGYAHAVSLRPPFYGQ
jgi:UTP--glucose-1-phosphate uridylyltransferase